MRNAQEGGRKGGLRTCDYFMLATLREPKVPERALFFMSITKMTVNKARLQRKKAPAALPVFSPAGSHNTPPRTA